MDSPHAPLNYTIAGEPLALYGMFFITTIVMAYVTLAGPSKSEKEEEPEEAEEAEAAEEETEAAEEPETTMVPGMGMMPTVVETEPVKPEEPETVEPPTEETVEPPKEETVEETKEEPKEETPKGGKRNKKTKKNKTTSSDLDELTTASGTELVFPFFHAKIAGIPLTIRFAFKNAYNSR